MREKERERRVCYSVGLNIELRVVVVEVFLFFRAAQSDVGQTRSARAQSRSVYIYHNVIHNMCRHVWRYGGMARDAGNVYRLAILQ